MNDESKKVPAAACRFAGNRFEFADAGDDDANAAPVRVLARSGKPIDHWYWGRVVHDLAGIQRKETVPLDWCHDDDQVIGFLDEFDVSNGDLECGGTLIPYQEGDRANEILFKGRAGVPYEASIFWGGAGIKIEELGTDATAEVNGYTLEGPATIIREWPLRGVAICPYGADQNTQSEFSSQEEVSVTVLSTTKLEETQMPDSQDVAAAAAAIEPLHEAGLVKRLYSGIARLLGFSEADEKQPTTEDTEGAEEEATAGEDAKAFAGKVTQFKAAFGPKGLDYLADGKTFEEAQQLHAAAEKAETEKRLAELTAERDELKTKLAQIDRGEAEPADFQAEDDDPIARAAGRNAANLGEKQARKAALMSQYMPAAKKTGS